MFEGMAPKTLMKWLILAAVVYLLVPFDLIPDFLGLPGRIDDVVTLVLLGWYYFNYARRYAATGPQRAADSGSAGAGQGASPRPEFTPSFDAYEILGVARSASPDKIKAAYRARMQEYHPDKVAHLGEELQRLAHEKSQEIQRAYKKLHG